MATKKSTEKTKVQIFNERLEYCRSQKWIINLSGKEYMTLKGLTWWAHDDGLTRLVVSSVFEDHDKGKFIFRAEAAGLKMIAGEYREIYVADEGDATSTNVGGMVRHHMRRMAQSRAIGRALRLYTGCGITCSEELGGDDSNDELAAQPQAKKKSQATKGQRQGKQLPWLNEGTKAWKEACQQLADQTITLSELMEEWGINTKSQEILQTIYDTGKIPVDKKAAKPWLNKGPEWIKICQRVQAREIKPESLKSQYRISKKFFSELETIYETQKALITKSPNTEIEFDHEDEVKIKPHRKPSREDRWDATKPMDHDDVPF